MGPILTKLDQLAPFLTYALCRRSDQPRPHLEELVRQSGLSERTFIRISRELSWKDIRVGQMDAFCQACGVDVLNPGEQLAFIRQTMHCQNSWSHLMPFQKLRLMQQFEQALQMKQPTVLASA